MYVGAATSVRVDSDVSSGNVAFMRERDIHIGLAGTMTVGAGTTLIPDVLRIFNVT